jgi:L-lactate permease
MFDQIYAPVSGSVLASALVAALPLLVIAVLLAVVRRPPWQAAVAAAAVAAGLAWAVWGMPAGLTLAAVTQGMAFGLWPISWVVFSAVFFYNLSVESGDFDVIRRSLARLTTDKRLLALLVAFGFGALVEGIAGFGAPVAITASMLAGLGFEPITAAVLALVANTAPVAFGSLGIPVTTLGGLLAPILGRDVETTTRALSAMVGRQLPFFSVLIPAYLVVLLSGWRGLMGVLPAVAVSGCTFAAAQFIVSNTLGPELTDTIAALCSIGALALLLRVWRPKGEAAPAASGRDASDSPGRVVRAFATYGILVAVVLIGQVGNFASLATPCVLTRGWAVLRRPIRRGSGSRSGSSSGQARTAWWRAGLPRSSGACRRWPPRRRRIRSRSASTSWRRRARSCCWRPLWPSP